MNATLRKFGYPNSILMDYEHWCVLMRPLQVTLGSLVLCAKSEATAFAELPLEAFAELHACTRDIEQVLGGFCAFDKINYLALMMVDPNVHFHVLPRYQRVQMFGDTEFPDSAWPGPPDLKNITALSKDTQAALQSALVDAFKKLV